MVVSQRQKSLEKKQWLYFRERRLEKEQSVVVSQRKKPGKGIVSGCISQKEKTLEKEIPSTTKFPKLTELKR